jgi:hypothetical protein
MAWISPQALPGKQVIFSNGSYGAAGMSLAINAAGKVEFQVGGATAGRFNHGASDQQLVQRGGNLERRHR